MAPIDLRPDEIVVPLLRPTGSAYHLPGCRSHSGVPLAGWEQPDPGKVSHWRLRVKQPSRTGRCRCVQRAALLLRDLDRPFPDERRFYVTSRAPRTWLTGPPELWVVASVFAYTTDTPLPSESPVMVGVLPHRWLLHAQRWMPQYCRKTDSPRALGQARSADPAVTVAQTLASIAEPEVLLGKDRALQAAAIHTARLLAPVPA